jgi:hypothetical protein
MTRAVLVWGMLFGGAALAQVDVESGSSSVSTSQSWSVVGPRTLAPGANALEAVAGFPGISGAYLRGVAPGINLGVRVGFAYGLEGLVREIEPGFKLQAVLKVRLLDEGKVSLGLTFEPGPFVYGSRFGEARVGFSIPVGFRLGIAASSALTVAVLLDLPMWVEFGRFGGFNLPILTGAGVEYFITSQFLVFFRAKVGPTLRTNRLAELSFEGSMGVGYRF